MSWPQGIVVCLCVFLLDKGSHARLNVFIDASEVSRFLPDLNTNLFLVQNGKVAAMLKRPILTSLIPPIDPQIKDMKFKFNASAKVMYSLSFHSSNESVMDHPRANIPLHGFVPRKTKGFKITFPCSAKFSGEVMLSINISFSTRTGKLLWGPLHLSLKRLCSKAYGLSSLLQTTGIPRDSSVPVPQVCNKHCTRKFILRRFCLSDYVIRARIESKVRKNGRLQLRVRVGRELKHGKVKINKRQLLERRGSEITCDCSDLKLKKVYLIFGKEDKRRRVLYVDDFTTALEWSTTGRSYVRLHKRKTTEKPCPARIVP